MSAPIATDNTVITARAIRAPEKIVNRLYFIAIIAAMKNVLSPISDTKITEKEDRKPWENPSLKDFLSLLLKRPKMLI